MHELLADVRSLEDTVSSELREVVVFLALVGNFELVLEHASLKQLEILSIGAPESEPALGSDILILE